MVIGFSLLMFVTIIYLCDCLLCYFQQPVYFHDALLNVRQGYLWLSSLSRGPSCEPRHFRTFYRECSGPWLHHRPASLPTTTQITKFIIVKFSLFALDR